MLEAWARGQLCPRLQIWKTGPSVFGGDGQQNCRMQMCTLRRDQFAPRVPHPRANCQGLHRKKGWDDACRGTGAPKRAHSNIMPPWSKAHCGRTRNATTRSITSSDILAVLRAQLTRRQQSTHCWQRSGLREKPSHSSVHKLQYAHQLKSESKSSERMPRCAALGGLEPRNGHAKLRSTTTDQSCGVSVDPCIYIYIYVCDI